MPIYLIWGENLTFPVDPSLEEEQETGNVAAELVVSNYGWLLQRVEIASLGNCYWSCGSNVHCHYYQEFKTKSWVLVGPIEAWPPIHNWPSCWTESPALSSLSVKFLIPEERAMRSSPEPLHVLLRSRPESRVDSIACSWYWFPCQIFPYKSQVTGPPCSSEK